MKKLASVLLIISIAFSLAACGNTGDDNNSIPVIGISQYGEHPSLDNCYKGFMLGLEEEGLKEGRDFELIYQNAGFDDNIAAQIAQNFSAKNVDLMCGIATISAASCYAAAEDKNIPVIFNAISDPV